MNIQSTTDYGLFEKITGNRLVNQAKIDKLIDDINNGLNLLAYCPIVVYEQDGKLKIVDGQHRFETSKKIESPVYYVVCEKLSLRQIARINSRSDKWKNKDFLECYINLGVEDYKTLSEFIQEYGIIYSAAIDLLMFGKVKSVKNSMDIFRDGDFKVKFLKEAKHIVELTMDVFDRYKFCNDRYLIQAMMDLEEDGRCDFEVLKQKISQAPNLMDQQSSAKEYIYNIERVYNHGNQKRRVIY